MRQPRLICLLALVTLTWLTAFAYRTDVERTGQAWRRATVAAVAALVTPDNRSRRPLMTLTSAAAITPTEPAPKADEIAGTATAALEPAQSGGSYNLTQSVIAGGGGVSTNGTSRVEGTLGQNLVGISSGGSYTLSSGFVNSSCPAVSLTTANLPNGVVNTAYSQTLAATGGTAPYAFSLGAGSLPNGLSLSSAGVLSGLPAQSGTFNFTVNATDSQTCSGARAYSLTIDCQTITVNPASVLPARQGLPYNQSFTQTGGVGAATWALTGVLPAGLTFNSATGTLSGSPTAFGSFNFTITATDAAGCSGQRAYTLTVLRRGVVKADFDGDGKTDLSVFRPTAVAPTPNWIILQSSTNTVVSLQWGGGYAPYFDTPVPANYDGDGKADLAIWRGADSIWYLRPSATPNNPILDLWGANYAPYVDIPTPGDYDGDGKADIAVFRRSGTWFVKRSSNGTNLIQEKGQAGDVPLLTIGVRSE